MSCELELPAAEYLADLTDEQRDAVEAVAGPVCIVAGAGTGKTTTITRRIAHQVLTGTFPANAILALTFTDKAAKEMAERLKRLRVPDVRARTFHAAALGVYKSALRGTGELLGSKAQLLFPLVKALPKEHQFVPLRDFAGEIERAKNERIKPKAYLEMLGKHRPPVPAELMHGVYQRYEAEKRVRGLVDMEDLLDYTARMLLAKPEALSAFRDQYRAFTVDEYQDVNLLQQTLLDVWLGDRNDVCVVGDDYQSIFGFTGATPRYLLDFPKRYRVVKVVTLTANYRSSPQILEVANRLAPHLGGARKTLSATQGAGPRPEIFSFATGEAELRWLTERIIEAMAKGRAAEEIAILYRINGRSEELEETLSRSQIPYQVKDQAFLRRPAAKSVLARLRRQKAAQLGPAMEETLEALSFQPDAPGDLEGEEGTRQTDLARLQQLALEFGVDRDVAAFLADLETRFTAEEDGRGVQLLTYHRAKGKEYEMVFLPRLEEGELPFALSKSAEEFAEERRLFYVGITRAKRQLLISWAHSRRLKLKTIDKDPSPFLDEIRPPRPQAPVRAVAIQASRARPIRAGSISVGQRSRAAPTWTLQDWLNQWRQQHRERLGGESSLMFDAMTLARIADARPRTVPQLLAISGVTRPKADRFGEEVLALISAHAKD